jgi:exodeoxyribonuclease III
VDSCVRIATWNVNSLNVRLPHLEAWLRAQSPDVVCLQETKCEESKFPGAAIEAMGYRWVHNGQKTYNGVAILAKAGCGNIGRGIPEFADDQSRVIAGDVGDVRIVCVYVPNGQSVGSDKYEYKLRWLEALRKWLAAELVAHPKMAVLGDYNIAPDARDVHDPLAWEGRILFSDPERSALKGLLDTGFVDSFRLFEQPEKSFTWWDYRLNAFKRKMGLRIDHVLLSSALAKACTACTIDTEPRGLERPSDHAPVICELNP